MKTFKELITEARVPTETLQGRRISRDAFNSLREAAKLFRSAQYILGKDKSASDADVKEMKDAADNCEKAARLIESTIK